MAERRPLALVAGGLSEIADADEIPIGVIPTGTSGTTVALGNAPAAAVTAHEAAGDPHPGYLTPAEGNAAYQPLDSDLTTIAGLTATTDNVIQSVAGSWASRTMAQLKTALAMVKADVGLGNVDNTSNATERAAARTLTNARVTKRVGTTASSSSLTIDSDAYDAYTVTALAAAITMNNPSGSPTEFQPLLMRFKDNGTARAFTWSGSQWRAVGVTLPTTTVISKTLYVGAFWNASDSKWDVTAIGAEA